ncbi:hypothetical protein [uncultured Senegalimassilia sp.]|uniref:hypothetical protein n=1 Tax=uncultured Senegalimassilia sp. TaxID=1714350 RepID=UPI0025CDF28A|nr:hypothetical protein [uncultured Senegalimassilia sp.]
MRADVIRSGEMRPELRAMIRDGNRRARKAAADGRYVVNGWVFDHEPAPDEVLHNPICRIGDYPL